MVTYLLNFDEMQFIGFDIEDPARNNIQFLPFGTLTVWWEEPPFPASSLFPAWL